MESTTHTPVQLPQRPFAAATSKLSLPKPSNISRAATPIDLDKVVVVPKISKIEFRCRCQNLTFDEAVESLKNEDEDIATFIQAHHELEAAKTSMKRFFRPEQIVDLKELSPERLKDASLVIALGGDDNLCFVSQRIQGKVPLLGIKGDSLSEGVLLGHSINDLEKLVKDLEAGKYKFEAWTRLKVEVDGKALPPAISTVFVGEQNSPLTSKNLTIIKDAGGNRLHGTEGKGIKQASSGILVYTGTGSTGWAFSASLYLFPNGRSFPRSSRYAELVQREPHVKVVNPANFNANSRVNTNSTIELPPLVHAPVNEGDSIEIKSSNKEGGIVNIDSVRVPFRRGSVVKIGIDPEPIWVVVKDNPLMNEHPELRELLELLDIEVNIPPLGIISRTLKDPSYPERALPSDLNAHYNPSFFEHDKLKTAPWAEKVVDKAEFERRKVNGEIRSYCGEVELDQVTGMPLNPIGRTGIKGRGVMGKYGANFAADPVVISYDKETNSYSLLEIQRNNGRWAFPGGMVDKGEDPIVTVFRELEEETSVKKATIGKYLVKDFNLDIYADDPRSTDNAWIETSARLFLLDKKVADKIKIKAGDDAKDIRWKKLDKAAIQELYGAHPFIVQEALRHILKMKSH